MTRCDRIQVQKRRVKLDRTEEKKGRYLHSSLESPLSVPTGEVARCPRKPGDRNKSNVSDAIEFPKTSEVQRWKLNMVESRADRGREGRLGGFSGKHRFPVEGEKGGAVL